MISAPCGWVICRTHRRAHRLRHQPYRYFQRAETVLSGFYNGTYDALVDFFSDNQTELRWKKGFDGEYYPYTHVNYVGGDGPPVGGGGIFKAARAAKGLKIGKSISQKNAIARLKDGKDVFTKSRSLAKTLAKKAGGGRTILDPAHKNGFFRHFHTYQRRGGHSFFGRPWFK